MSRSIDSFNSLLKDLKEAAFLEGDFTTRSGKKTNYYIDKYLFSTQPHILQPLAKALAQLLPDPMTYDRIAAPELGAVAIAAALSIEVNKPFVIVRKSAKGYGTDNLLEGTCKAGETVVIVEDILTTGGAALMAADALVNAGIKVKRIVGVVNREEGALENIQAQGYEMDALITTTDLKSC